MTEKAAIFEKTYRRYLKQIARMNPAHMAGPLGLRVEGDGAVVPFFNRHFRVSGEKITDDAGHPASYSVCIILFKYLLMCPVPPPVAHQRASFKDFRDAAPLVGYFSNTAERPIADTFTGRMDDLMRAAQALGGFPVGGDYPYDLCIQLAALPRVPLLLLFNDADEEFPARCTILFERCVEAYLDMECVAAVGMLLAVYLKRNAGDTAAVS